MRRLIAGSLLTATLLGCEPTDQASPSTLADGSTHLTKAMRGIWGAPGGPSCRWWVQTKDGVITNPGNTTGPVSRRRQKSGRAADQSQGVVIGTGNVGQYLKSDRCGGWKR